MVSKPSNPVTCFINGNKTESFTYKPGAVPHYAIIRSKHHIAMSVLLFADDEKHVRKILNEAVKFAASCLAKKRADREAHGRDDKHGIDSQQASVIDKVRDVLTGKNKEYTLTIDKAERNQLYKIGWAANDTVL